jgi:hypothetical protein
MNQRTNKIKSATLEHPVLLGATGFTSKVFCPYQLSTGAYPTRGADLL